MASDKKAKSSRENTTNVAQEVLEKSFGKKAFEAAFQRPDTKVRLFAAIGLWAVLLFRIEEIADIVIGQWLGLSQSDSIAQTVRFCIVDVGRVVLVIVALVCIGLLVKKIRKRLV